MLDRDDKQILKEAKNGGAILVTTDRVLRVAAGGMTPHEVLEKAIVEGKGTNEARAEVSRLHTLKPGELTVLAEAGNKTYQSFRQHIEVNQETASLIRRLRVDKSYSWRAVARFCSKRWRGPWGGNQIAGMVICEKAAKLLGEDFMEPPWN
ncbi:MAG: hypothetical protein V2A77_01045 [Pseudomonadota bacterium]